MRGMRVYFVSWILIDVNIHKKLQAFHMESVVKRGSGLTEKVTK